MGSSIRRSSGACPKRLFSSVLSWERAIARHARSWPQVGEPVLQIKGTQGRPPQKPQAHGPDTLVGKLQTGKLTDLFVIVYTPPAAYAGGQNPGKPFRFFIATRQELQAIRNPGKQQPKFTSDWVKYPGISRFEDRWDKLPQP